MARGVSGMPMLEGVDGAIAALKLAQKTFIDNFALKVRRVVELVHRGVLDRHPVWSGESIAAWRWYLDGAPKGSFKATEESFTETQRESFGHTGGMGLGGEPRRAAATAEVEGQLAILSMASKDPWHKYILSNSHPRTLQLEYGELPTTVRSRSPGGMVRITEAEVISMIGSF